MSAAAKEVVSAQTRLLKLTCRRLEKYATLLPKVLVSNDPETIHDLRVWSRRLQQALRVIAPPAQDKKSKSLLAALRDVRQTLGPCRDLDVNIALLESKRQHHGTGSVQRAWESMQSELISQRGALIERVRRDIAGQDLFKFIIRAQSLIARAERDFDPLEQIINAMVKSMDGWEASFAATREQPDAAALHALRIAGKKLRYRAELLAALGQPKVNPLVKTLKEIQTTLGDWHDRSVLLHQVAEFIGRPGFLAEHPDIGRILLAEMEKERLRSDTEVANVLQQAAKVQESWVTWRARATVD
ncbi:MAG: CHAD domain-containing protein [Candidatus Binatia bacterium]